MHEIITLDDDSDLAHLVDPIDIDIETGTDSYQLATTRTRAEQQLATS
ncbi:hypothetical protein ACFT9I_22725 [Streptomyces sp. NPDC057137]